eukprot:scaffold26723_cov153-Skeletonema_menzelii.AAC.2
MVKFGRQVCFFVANELCCEATLCDYNGIQRKTCLSGEGSSSADDAPPDESPRCLLISAVAVSFSAIRHPLL